MAELFRCTNRYGRDLVLTEKRWTEIRVRRSWIADRRYLVERALSDPIYIARDPNDDTVQYYYLRRKDGSYLRAEVRFAKRRLLGSIQGFVTDVLIVTGIASPETMLWTPMM